MRKQIFVLLFLLGIFLTGAILGTYGCIKNNIVDPGPDTDDPDGGNPTSTTEDSTDSADSLRVVIIDSLFSTAGDYRAPGASYENEESAGSTEEQVDGEVWVCNRREIDARKALDSFSVFDPNSEVIWPGAALQGKSIQFATPDPIIAPRAGGKVVINDINGDTLSSIQVDEVTHSNIVDAANRIIRNRSTKLPAYTSFSLARVRSKEELSLKLGANASFFGLFGAKSKFEFNEKANVSTFLVSLNQVFYTLAFERPQKAAHFFANDVTAQDLAPFVGEGNYPVYVSSVTYGRIFYLLISAVEESDKLEASLSASFVFGGFKGGVEHVSALTSLTVQSYALGGDSDESLAAVQSGISSLDTFIEKIRSAADIRLGKPLSYAIRTVRTATSVKNELSTNFTVSDDCVPVPPGISVPSTVDFGGVCRNNTAVKTLTIQNTGGSIAQVEIIPPPCRPLPDAPVDIAPCFVFDVEGFQEIKPGVSLDVQVSFSPWAGPFGIGCIGRLECEAMIKWHRPDKVRDIPVVIRGQGLLWTSPECQN